MLNGNTNWIYDNSSMTMSKLKTPIYIIIVFGYDHRKSATDTTPYGKLRLNVVPETYAIHHVELVHGVITIMEFSFTYNTKHVNTITIVLSLE